MNKYRYFDYYQMTEIFDNLYEKSKNNKRFNKLHGIIASENNIKLAFRMIKANHGSKTPGVDGVTIRDIKETEIERYVQRIKENLNSYKSDRIRRVWIPKGLNDKRPLGIPTLEDRIIQQAIKQVLEPICEAKFHNHSYGFRPNRSVAHALARVNYLINQAGFYYTVDLDIKSFFDNVNHNKLINQLYTLGIRDRKVLVIIKQILKAKIQGEGETLKGTPQGGILSPLLANVVLNEFDWWISSQWETIKTKRKYHNKSNVYRALNTSRLKKVFIVRYADDIKIMCKSYNEAKRILIASKRWLKTRLGLDVSDEKTKIINLRKQYSEFLGFKIKVKRKGKTLMGYYSHSRIKNKNVLKIQNEISQKVKMVQKYPTCENVNSLNSLILGTQLYFRYATHMIYDIDKIAYSVKRLMHSRFKGISKYKVPTETTKTYEKLYSGCRAKTWIIKGLPIYPLSYVQHKSAMSFAQDICDYTKRGRNKSTKRLINETEYSIKLLSKNYIKNRSVEYNDNRISRSSMCLMRCEITKTELDIDTVHCHHVIPVQYGGDDKYSNLLIVNKDIHKLIHATQKETIEKYKYLIKNKRSLNKINKLRAFCKLEKLDIIL